MKSPNTHDLINFGIDTQWQVHDGQVDTVQVKNVHRLAIFPLSFKEISIAIIALT